MNMNTNIIFITTDKANNPRPNLTKISDTWRKYKGIARCLLYTIYKNAYIQPHACTRAHRHNGVNKLPGYCRPSINKAVCKSQPMRYWILESKANQNWTKGIRPILHHLFSTQTDTLKHQYWCWAVCCMFLAIATEPNISQPSPCILMSQRGRPLLPLYLVQHTHQRSLIVTSKTMCI